MESATVRIVDFVSGSPEWLSVSSDFNFPNLTTNVSCKTIICMSICVH